MTSTREAISHTEKNGNSYSGYLAILGFFALALFGVVGIIGAPVFAKIAGVFILMFSIVCSFGLYMVQPNQGKVLQLFGRYKGTGPSHRFALEQSLLHQARRESAIKKFRKRKT